MLSLITPRLHRMLSSALRPFVRRGAVATRSRLAAPLRVFSSATVDDAPTAAASPSRKSLANKGAVPAIQVCAYNSTGG